MPPQKGLIGDGVEAFTSGNKNRRAALAIRTNTPSIMTFHGVLEKGLM